VHPRAGGRGYARSRFGAVGYDADGNGCDTRDDALRRDVRGGVPSTDGCGVVGGSVSDPYTGARIPRTGAGTVVVAHVVALPDAWTTGAADLSAAQLRRLANDPLNLVTTGAVVAAAKGASDAASWLPPRRAARCPYVAQRIAVKQAYHLWITVTERAAMQHVLAGCPDEPLPGRQPWPAVVGADGGDGTAPAPTEVAPSAGDGARPTTSDRPVHPTLSAAPTAAVPAPVAVEPTARSTRGTRPRRPPVTPTAPWPTPVEPSPHRR
jgi:hypothetical protein